MPKLKVAFNKTTNVATVLDASGSVPSGSVEVGQFDHPDLTYPDSRVIYHGVRDILYKRSAKDPAQAGFWPNNINSMQAVSIDFKGTPRLVIADRLPRVISTVEGKDVTWTVVAKGGKAPLTYKWFWNDIVIDDTVNPTAKTASLVNHAVTAASAGVYKVEITDASGTKVDDSSILAVAAYPATA